jgi:hypothetical protein
MGEREDMSVELVKKPYEEPTLIEREDLLQVTEGDPVAGISEGLGLL